MSDTPETDAAVLQSEGQWSFVLKECCQRLERERDQWRKCAEKFRNYLWTRIDLDGGIFLDFEKNAFEEFEKIKISTK